MLSISFIIFALLFSLHPTIDSDPGSHSMIGSCPTPHCGSCLPIVPSNHTAREATALASPVDSRRIAPTHATKVFSITGPFLFLQIKSQPHHGEIRISGDRSHYIPGVYICFLNQRRHEVEYRHMYHINVATPSAKNTTPREKNTTNNANFKHKSSTTNTKCNYNNQKGRGGEGILLEDWIICNTLYQ